MNGSGSRFAFLAGALLAAVPGAGNAQDARDAAPGARLSPPGAYVLLGGGVTDFTKSATRDRFDLGGGWDVRLGVGNRFWVGGELAYVGAMRRGVGSGPDLLMNGTEGILRLQVPYASGKWLVEPFAFGGIGWTRVSLQNAPAGLKDADDVGVVPFGAGITIGYAGFLFDARFTYRAMFSEDLPLAANQSPASLQQWGVNASIGYEF